jgi:hypothetical protein
VEQDASCAIAHPSFPYRGWLAANVSATVNEARRYLAAEKTIEKEVAGFSEKPVTVLFFDTAYIYPDHDARTVISVVSNQVYL